MKKIITSLVALLCWIPNLLAQQQTPFVSHVSNVGTAAATFLNIGVGARAIGMGSAFTAIANDASALYWNPACLTQLDRPQVPSTHSDWLLDIYHDFIGAVLPVGRHRFGVSLTYLGMPDQVVRTIGQPEGTGNFYNASDLALAVAWGFPFTDQFSLGITAKHVQQQIYNAHAAAWALDFGAHYSPSRIKWLQLGMQIANFGTDLKFSGHDLDRKIDIDPDHQSNDRLPAALETDPFSLPLNFRFGVAAKPIFNKTHQILAAIDLLHPSHNTESLSLGFEYTFRGYVALRGGYESFLEKDYQETGGLTLGAGMKLYAAGTLLVLDYAWRDFGVLNDVGRVSCILQF